MMQYPILGIGVHNFTTYSGRWKEVHNSYLQMGVEEEFQRLVLYLMFFWSGFSNLRRLRKRGDLDPQVTLFVGALHSSLVGFCCGGSFFARGVSVFSLFRKWLKPP